MYYGLQAGPKFQSSRWLLRVVDVHFRLNRKPTCFVNVRFAGLCSRTDYG